MKKHTKHIFAASATSHAAEWFEVFDLQRRVCMSDCQKGCRRFFLVNPKLIGEAIREVDFESTSSRRFLVFDKLFSCLVVSCCGLEARFCSLHTGLDRPFLLPFQFRSFVVHGTIGREVH